MRQRRAALLIVELLQLISVHNSRADNDDRVQRVVRLSAGGSVAASAMFRRSGAWCAMHDGGGNVLLPSRVPWYDYSLHPAVRFLFWSKRHLNKIPEDWRPYYDKMLRNEVRANRLLNTPWDVFIATAEGYRKAKWVLHKYGQEPEPHSIPHPYDDFWKSTTHEERVWAYRRSHQLKELQALQRDDADIYGGVVLDRSEVTIEMSSKMGNSRNQNGNQVHSMDLPAPTEREIRENEDFTLMFMSSVEEDRSWNPAVKAREYRETLDSIGGLMAFEDDDDDEGGADGDEQGPASDTAKAPHDSQEKR
jgi:hypothetical protein